MYELSPYEFWCKTLGSRASETLVSCTYSYALYSGTQSRTVVTSTGRYFVPFHARIHTEAREALFDRVGTGRAVAGGALLRHTVLLEESLRRCALLCLDGLLGEGLQRWFLDAGCWTLVVRRWPRGCRSRRDPVAAPTGDRLGQ